MAQPEVGEEWLPPAITKKTGIQLLILFVILWPLYDMLTLHEDFPFAPYTMYDSLYTTHNWQTLKTFAVDDKGNEIDLVNIRFGAWDEARFNQLINSKMWSHDGRSREERLNEIRVIFGEAVGDWRKNVKGTPDAEGRNIVGLRLYTMKWEKVTAENRLTPDIREVLVEYNVDEKQAGHR